MYKKGDFHLHTTASDGKLSSTELVKEAALKGLDIIAITDHDTTMGIEAALKAAETYDIKVIPGIELSTLHNEESIHILGYFKDDAYKSDTFQSFLKEMHDYRAWRGERIVDNLKIYFDLDIDGEKLLAKSKGIIARPHIAQAIIDAGYKYDWGYIFETFLSKDSPAYIPNKKISIQEGIKLLKDVNALAVLAHPVLIKKSTIEELIEFDFDGIEGIYPLNTSEITEKFIGLANNHHKFVTAGSDYHGLGEQDSKHGIVGSIYLTDEKLSVFLSKLKAASEN